MTDRYLPLALNVLGVDKPLPVDVWSDRGLLLLARGQRVQTFEQLRHLVAHRPMLREEDYWRLQAVGQGEGLLRAGTGHALVRAPLIPPAAANMVLEPAQAWPMLHARLSAVLRAPEPETFVERLDDCARFVAALAGRYPDDSLFVLIQMVQDPSQGYSATHALLAALVGELLAEPAGLPQADRDSLRLAALTMNIAMSRLHDALALQKSAPSPVQRADIKAHPEAGRRQLETLWVRDPVWLGLVQDHHETPGGRGYPAGKTDLSMPQRLLHLADVFVARISPRANRGGLSPLTALRNLYLENDPVTQQLGELMVKTLGLYPPGSYVRLRNGETAVVVRRGRRANEPEALAIVNPQGLPIAVPATRDTGSAAHAVVSTVLAETVKVRLDPARILKRA